MISIVLATKDAELVLPRALESLIRATIEGVVREVIVVDAHSGDGTCIIAEGMGARIVQANGSRGAQWRAGAKAARQSWLLFLDQASALETGWEREAEDFITRVVPEQPRAGLFRFALDGYERKAWHMETAAAMRARLFAYAAREQAVLLPRALYDAIGGHRAQAHRPESDLTRRLGSSRITHLRSRTFVQR
jgi:glycosyltransferase involved in cell wall biosynthesis